MQSAYTAHKHTAEHYFIDAVLEQRYKAFLCNLQAKEDHCHRATGKETPWPGSERGKLHVSEAQREVLDHAMKGLGRNAAASTSVLLKYES